MKKILVPIVVSLLALAGCSQSTAGNSTKQPTSQSVQSSAPAMPEVVGLTASEAVTLLEDAGITADFVGPDGKQVRQPRDANTTVKKASISANTPVRTGQRATIILAASEAELTGKPTTTVKAAPRYQFTCTTGTSTYSDPSPFQATDFRAVWASPTFAALKKCDVSVAGKSAFEEFSLVGSEQAIVEKVAANQGDVSIPSGAVLDVYEACTLPPTIDFDASRGPNNNRVEAIATAALDLCGDAPFAEELTRIASGLPPAQMKDGTHRVGVSIQPGIYQVQLPEGSNGVHDCYWERTTAQGDTIANDFITYAPEGPIVSVFDGEGFVSQRCGSWSRIG